MQAMAHHETPRRASTLSELTCLGLHRPGRDATAAQLAAYYGELATVHQHLAAEAATVADRRRELELAGRISDRATALMAARQLVGGASCGGCCPPGCCGTCGICPTLFSGGASTFTGSPHAE